MPPTPTPAQLERLGRYRIVRPLSKGGMALVYEARRESLAGVSPRVAIKLILPEHATSDTFQELFINEARLGASMHHQNLVQIQDFDRDGDHFFLVMEYVEGLTFRRIMTLCSRNNVRIPLGAIAELGRQACDGLHHAHGARDERGRPLGLVHRDMKPSNLILNPQGVVKVLDFGISKGALMPEKRGAVRGTWGYMAPEQAFGQEVGPAADVFGLAVVLCELASLRPLFKSKESADVKALLVDDHAARMAATLDAQYGPLVSVLVRALQRDPSARYALASDFGRALSALLPDPITARDEVVRFYEVVQALDAGRPVPHQAHPPAVGAASQGSIAGVPSANHEDDSSGWIVAGVAGSAVAAVLLVGVVMVVVLGPMIWGRGSTSDAAVPTERSDPAVLIPTDLPQEPVRPPPATSIGIPPVVPELAIDTSVAEPPPAEPEDSEPVRPEPVRIVVERTRPSPPPEPAPEAPTLIKVPVPVVPDPEPPSESTSTAASMGRLTVSAQPAGLSYEIYVDGQFVKKGPFVRKEFSTGRHFVTISAADGRIKRFEVDLRDNDELRRVWDFDRGEWRR